VKIVTVDVSGADDAIAAAAVHKAVSLAGDADRLLLFGHAAIVAARIDQQEREEREGAWLDEAAAWLLKDEGKREPPPRPAPKPLMKATAVVPARAEALALPRSDRVLEMVGALLVMAVPSGDDVDAVDNAHLWLVGGAPFGVAQHGTRAVVTLGDRVVVVSVLGGEAGVVAHAFDGTTTEQALGLQVSSRMSVRGLSA
jgi:hypothetical protein